MWSSRWWWRRSREAEASGFGTPGAVHPAGEAGFPACGGALAHGPAGHGLVESARRSPQPGLGLFLISGSHGFGDPSRLRLQPAAHAEVAHALPFVLPIPLDLGPNVCHGARF
jgi:hypothetical protein